MTRRLVQYRTKPERSAENQEYIERVFEALRREQPAGLRYAAFRLADGVSFVHIVSYETSDANTALTSLPAFKAFTAGVQERCESPPVSSELTEVGSFGW